MYQRIVVPVDGSGQSEQVIPHARVVAAGLGASITLLYVVRGDDTENGEVAAVRYRAAALGLPVDVVAGDGDVPGEILRRAGAEPDTLVAMTSHGRGGVMGALLGSVARDVVRSSHEPVLLYHPHGTPAADPPDRIEEILLPLDGTPLAASMRETAAAWSRALGARLKLIQVLPAGTRSDPALASVPTSDLLESGYLARQAREIHQECGVDPEYDVLHGEPVEAIARYVHGRSDVMAVMATRGRSRLREAVLGGVTAGLLHRSGIPLIVQAPDQNDDDAT